MGEIGISRKEFLYDIRFWEARRIIRGYRKRGKIFMQLLAENVYATIYTMRDAKGKKVEDMFPSIFDDDDDDYEPIPEISEEEKQELLDLMAAENARLASERLQSTQEESSEP